MSKMIIDADGNKEWWFNGKRHREDGPAVEWVNGHKEWWLNGNLHREGGPAIERASGSKQWWLVGNLHREDGPAVEGINGSCEWWLNGNHLTKEALLESLPEDLKIKALFSEHFIRG
jgi:hypothetical protein